MSITFKKGIHALTVIDNGTMARIKGISGKIDSIELITLLTLNGYQVIE